MNDEFSSRYRLLKCVLVEDGVRTHNAQELATGRVVMVHITDAAAPEEVESLRARLLLLGDQEKNRVLETATIASGFAVVTEFLPGSTSFLGWLDSNAQKRATELPAPAGMPLGPPADPVPLLAAEPGEFTRLFTPPPTPASGRPKSAGEHSGGPPTPRPVQVVPRITRPVTTENERTPLANPPIPTPALPALAVSPLSAVSASPPGFAVSPVAPVLPASPVAPALPVSPNLPAQPQPVAAQQFRTEPPVPSGEFTQLFNPGALRQHTPEAFVRPQSPVPQPETPPLNSGNLGAPFPAFGAPVPDPYPTTEVSAARPSAPIVPVVAPVSSPGEFTRLFSTPELAAPEPEVKRASAINTELPPSWSPLGAAAGAPVSPISYNPISARPPASSRGLPDSNLPNYGGFGGPLPIARSEQPVVRESPLSDHRQTMGNPGGVPSVVQPPQFRDGDPALMTPFGSAAKGVPANAGPSPYTLVMQKGFESAAVKPAPKPEAIVEPPAKRRTPMALILVINAVLLLVVVLIAFLYRRPRMPTVRDVTPSGLSVPTTVPTKSKPPA